ncbi:MAG: hypothetical protein LBC75_02625 [Fibromonadaceae bacterium]|jgi:hypothetical protein|nr:hypothetical protein [Fibromonadaceae bacterium]
MQLKTIDIAKLAPTERQRVTNGILGYDEYNKLALMPSRKHLGASEAKYIDTVSRPTYQIEVFEKKFIHDGQTWDVPVDVARHRTLRKVLFEKTLQGNVYIALFNDSALYWMRNRDWQQLFTSGIDSQIIDITYAFNRLIVATRDTVLWSQTGLNPKETVEKGNLSIGRHEIGHKQSDNITQPYIGLYADSANLYIMTLGGCEVWIPTQDASDPFIYKSARACRIEDSENEFALMSDDSHRLGLYSFAEDKWLTDDRWTIKKENFTDLKVFWNKQNGNKMLAVYERDKMWLYDLKYGFMTMQTEIFFPWQDLGEDIQSMCIELLLDKGIYGSLFLQLGKFPEEIQFYIDSLYAKHSPLLAFERDDVIKTTNIGKLTVDTPLELNFKGYTAIYSIGISTNRHGG